jgi:hypothetical protein
MQTTADKGKKQSAGKTSQGFSKRFNILLNHAGFRPLRKGRESDLAARFGASQAGTRKWLYEDVVPRNIRDIVESLLTDIDTRTSVGATLKWLWFGHEHINPFALGTTEINPATMTRVLRVFHNIARRHKVDIDNFSDRKIDLICEAILRNLADEGTIDEDFVLLLLRLADSP